MQQVGIHLLRSNAEFDIEYTYLVDEVLVQDGLIIRGSFVDVQFGKRKQLEHGVVWSLGKICAAEEDKTGLKIIAGISKIRPALFDWEIELAEQMAKMYFCSVGACVKCMIPPEAQKGKKIKYATLCVSPEYADEAALCGKLKNISHIRMLEALKNGSRAVTEIIKEIGCTASVAATLEKKGYIKIEKDFARERKQTLIENVVKSSMPTYDKHVLNSEQQKAFDFIKGLKDKNKFAECLLHGVTGSGKTELYMQLIYDTAANGEQAILLVPEISLTPQMTAHFVNRFGNKVAVLHSRLSDGERNSQWNRIKNGDVSVVIGARSAIFAPAEKLKLIILDEEHEASYKSEESAPCYSAAEVAEIIGRIRGITVVYGSATPSIETFYRAVKKDIYYISLKKRANDALLPTVIVDDLREEREKGGIDSFSIFSKYLIDEMNNNLKNGMQTMIFVHRRGYSRQLTCKSCGSTMKCSRCNIPMTYHEKGNRIICHYCGATEPAPSVCPICGEKEFEKKGIGTQKVVEQIKDMFPEAGVLQMDTDTTATQGGYEKILTEFALGKADFLVGTQMIAKGHDFPNVTLVGIIGADSLLQMPNYKAQERAYQLFSQMSGRAGRGKKQGKVIIQTYSPDDYAVTAAAAHNYEEFFKNEIAVRKNLQYPPFSSMCIIRFSSENDKGTYAAAFNACDLMRKIENEELDERGGSKIQILGPARAEMPKVNGKYRWLITLKSEKRQNIVEFLNKVTNNRKLLKKIRGTATLSIRFDGR